MTNELRTGHEQSVVEPIGDVLAALSEARQHRRIKNLDPFEALYKAYLGGIALLVVTYALTSTAGDSRITGSHIEPFVEWAPRSIGAVIALAWAVAARSGGRGGPLAIEAPDVFHILLGPVDRHSALRRPALRLIRFYSFCGLVVGGLFGLGVAQRAEGLPLTWMVAGAFVGAMGVGSATAFGLIVSGLRLKSWIASVMALVLLSLSAAEFWFARDLLPFTYLGKVAVFPMDKEWVGFVAALLPVVTIIIALRTVSSLSIESAQRRSDLVTQLRFAATVRDVRAVMLLRRQLSHENTRAKPWFTLPAGLSPLVFVRDIRGFLRWPIVRILRLVACSVAIGVCLIAIWRGTTPAIVLVGLFSYVVGLEAAESVAEEADRPDVVRAIARPTGWLLLGHLPMTLIVSSLSMLIAVGVPALMGESKLPVWLLFPCAICGGLLSAAGGTISALSQSSINSNSSMNEMAFGAEGLSIILMARIAGPPLICTIGWIPYLVGELAFENQKPVESSVLAAIGGAMMIFILFLGWLRFREEIHGWVYEAKDAAKSSVDPAAMVERAERSKVQDADNEKSRGETQGTKSDK